MKIEIPFALSILVAMFLFTISYQAFWQALGWLALMLR